MNGEFCGIFTVRISPGNGKLWRAVTADQELCIGEIFYDRQRQLCSRLRHSV